MASACSLDPGAPLIPLPERQATVLPTEADPITPDGFANVLADPATVAGLPRPQSDVEQAENAVAAEGAALEARGQQLAGRGTNAAALEQQGRTHVADTQAQIMANARPLDPTGNSTPAAPASNAPAAAPERPPGVPIDPDAPTPRTVYD